MTNEKSILDQIEIAKPCSANWESMSGDDRERACKQCSLNVYNISSMNKLEAEQFLMERLPQGRVCVRLYRRADGTIITDNCPQGLRAARDAAIRVKRRVAAAITMAFAFIAAPTWAQNQKNDPSGTATLGRVRAVTKPSTIKSNSLIERMGETSTMMGAPAPLSASQLALQNYLHTVSERVKADCPERGKQDKLAKVTFKIAKDGSASDIKITESSGRKKRDQEIIDAVKKTARFAAPPAEQGPTVNVTCIF